MRRKERVRSRGVETALAIGVLLSGLGIAAALLVRAASRGKLQQRVEKTRDKALKDSFPASDPPASQYFDIPANRL